MARDISLERTILEILDRLAPVPLLERTLLREAEIAADRLLVTADFQDALRSLHERRLVNRGESALGLPIVWITEAGRAALRS